MINRESNIIVTIIEEITDEFLVPLYQNLSSTGKFDAFMRKLGWNLTTIPEPLSEISANLGQTLTIIENIFRTGLDSSSISHLKDLIKNSFALIKQIEHLNFDRELKELEFAQKVPEQIVQLLLVEYLEKKHRRFASVLKLAGIIHSTYIKQEKGLRTSYVEKTIHLEKITSLFRDPFAQAKKLPYWQLEYFEPDVIIGLFTEFLGDLGVQVYLEPCYVDYLDKSQIPRKYPNFVIYRLVKEGRLYEMGFRLAPTPKQSIKGIFIFPYITGAFDQQFDISDRFLLEFESTLDVDDDLRLFFHPATGIAHVPNPQQVDDTNLGEVKISLKPKANGEIKKILRFAEDSFIGYDQIHLSSGVRLVDYDNPEAFIEATLDKLIINLKIASSFSFLSSLLPKEGLRTSFALTTGVSSLKGIYFNGEPELNFSREINFSFRNTRVSKFNLQLQPDGDLELTSSFTIKSKLGPVNISVDKTGLGFSLGYDGSSSGNLGVFNVDAGFAPPAGIGVQVDSPIISGGGFLELDHANHRYFGVLALRFWEIELAAIGLINTRLPNQEKGFSMLINISVYFQPPLQLSMGFTLNAVGGLVGIQRTMKVDVLRERILNGGITSIMFPPDLIKNAPKIISDLRAVFPPQKDHYIVAPFLRIGYGTPTIVEVDLGVLVEIPFRRRLILLGSVGVYLPNKSVNRRLVELHIDILGDFNFAASYISLEGRLRKSHVVGIPLSGGFAFLLDWGSQPQFLFSVGGYHPRYKKPARFPDVPRLKAEVKKGSTVRLTCEYYQAITSNSFQIGFSAELVVKKGAARAYGFLGFNALLQFDPFYFEADIRISVGVTYYGRSFFGVDLYFLLSGPKPWRAKGYAKIKIWFFSLKIRFNISWGGEQKISRPTLQPAVLLDRLREQLDQPANWSAQLPAYYALAESLRSLEETEKQDRIFIHPSGYLELRQQLLPLDRTIEKLGNSYVAGQPVYRIDGYQLGEELIVQANRPLQEYFSRGQYEELTDAEKISTADFEMMPAGVEVSAREAFSISGQMAWVSNDFEEIFLEEKEIDRGRETGAGGYNWQEDRRHTLPGLGRELDPERPEAVYGVVETLPEFEERHYKILSLASLEPPPELAGRYFDSYAAAKEYLRRHWPSDRDKWRIREVVARPDEVLLEVASLESV